MMKNGTNVETQFLKLNLKSSCTIAIIRNLRIDFNLLIFSNLMGRESKKYFNRQLATNMHIIGPSSFAFVREQLKQEDTNKEEPSKVKVYGHSRKRKPGKSYKLSFGEIVAYI
ncbi:Tudor domain-containing protein 1, partial [Bienertia sinuspersici]